MDPLTPSMGYILRLLNFASVLICVLCIKRRSLADALYPIECVCRIIAVFHLNPASYGYDYIDYVYIYSYNYLVFACGQRIDIVFQTVSFATSLFLGDVAYARPFDTKKVYLYVFLVACCIVFSTQFNMLVHYISNLNTRIRLVNEAHINVMNKMHEGVLILSESTAHKPSKFLFCNGTA